CLCPMAIRRQNKQTEISNSGFIELATPNPIRTCAKKLGIFGQIRPHPGPLPSDGRGRIVLRRSAFPTALEAARDGSGCSLSRRTGEGQGEGRSVGDTPPVRHLFLHKPLVVASALANFNNRQPVPATA